MTRTNVAMLWQTLMNTVIHSSFMRVNYGFIKIHGWKRVRSRALFLTWLGNEKDELKISNLCFLYLILFVMVLRSTLNSPHYYQRSIYVVDKMLIGDTEDAGAYDNYHFFPINTEFYIVKHYWSELGGIFKYVYGAMLYWFGILCPSNLEINSMVTINQKLRYKNCTDNLLLDSIVKLGGH